MWQLLNISEQPFFVCCNFNDNKQDVTFILHDLKTIWSETSTLSEVKQKVKLLNKRFDFNENNIKDALKSGGIQSVVLEQASNQDIYLLKLKYRVKNCLLSYEWSLRKQSLLEFQQTFVQPLLHALLGCHQQIEILKDSIRKKDIELKQFRIEGAVLNRKTLVTKPFDFEDFNKKFEECNNTVNNFRELAKYVTERESKEESKSVKKLINLEKTKAVQSDGNLKDDQRSDVKMSPRQKKRKVNEKRVDHLQQHLKLRKLGLEYESSQSQNASCGNSQTFEDPNTKDLELQQQISAKEQENYKKAKISTPQKSSRYITLKQKLDKLSSEDTTDSDNEDPLSTLLQRKVTRSLINQQKDASVNSKNAQTKVNTKINSTKETKQKSVKSFSLSNNSRRKSSKYCMEKSNVFDFSTESDDDISLLDRKNSQKNKTEKDLQKLNSKKLLKNNFSTVSSNKDSESINKPSTAFDFISVDSVISIKPPSLTNNLNCSSTPVIVSEISSQLDNIKKELETLEAMRLADLKQRTCKV